VELDRTAGPFWPVGVCVCVYVSVNEKRAATPTTPHKTSERDPRIRLEAIEQGTRTLFSTGTLDWVDYYSTAAAAAAGRAQRRIDWMRGAPLVRLDRRQMGGQW
jgi:hypothetical protein